MHFVHQMPYQPVILCFHACQNIFTIKLKLLQPPSPIRGWSMRAFHFLLALLQGRHNTLAAQIIHTYPLRLIRPRPAAHELLYQFMSMLSIQNLLM